jgi:hypothetical protein
MDFKKVFLDSNMNGVQVKILSTFCQWIWLGVPMTFQIKFIIVL